MCLSCTVCPSIVLVAVSFDCLVRFVFRLYCSRCPSTVLFAVSFDCIVHVVLNSGRVPICPAPHCPLLFPGFVTIVPGIGSCCEARGELVLIGNGLIAAHP